MTITGVWSDSKTATPLQDVQSERYTIRETASVSHPAGGDARAVRCIRLQGDVTRREAAKIATEHVRRFINGWRQVGECKMEMPGDRMFNVYFEFVACKCADNPSHARYCRHCGAKV